jgi:hypothetical protein
MRFDRVGRKGKDSCGLRNRASSADEHSNLRFRNGQANEAAKLLRLPMAPAFRIDDLKKHTDAGICRIPGDERIWRQGSYLREIGRQA